MEPLALKPRQLTRDEVESWDDDDDLQGLEDLQFRNVSSTTTATYASSRTPHHRDSLSSRVSVKSDLDDEGDWQLHLPADDDVSTSRAIADAKSKGIPIPANVPPSALLGGTIKRLGGKRIKKVLGDDWSDDLEIPKAEGLRLKINDGNAFPESLRQLSTNLHTSPLPARPQANLSFMERLQSSGKVHGAMTTLEKFRDESQDNDFGDIATIKVAKTRAPIRTPTFDQSPVKSLAKKKVESFDDDLELPVDGELRLSARKEIPRTPASHLMEDLEPDWADGSQGSYGTSHGGARRTGRSNRSSSVSARSPSIFSPSLSSCLTAESEDEGLDGLILPDGPIEFGEALQKRIENNPPVLVEEKKADPKREPLHAAKDDFFSGIEIGDGDVFGSGKLTLNRNIKHKATQQTSPKRTAVTLTFTNKPGVPITRIPKPAGQERQRSKLEPVMESGPATHVLRRTTSRVGGHSNQSSVTSIPTPSSTSFVPNSGPATPSRRGLTSRASRDVIREPTTTSAQLLKSKRSMPALSSSSRKPLSPTRTQPTFQRPPSRTDKNVRNGAPSRPKTPVDRADSSLANARRPPVPFLPAGNVNAFSHHITSKSSRSFHRPTSSDSTSNENAPPLTRSGSRLSNNHHRPYTPTIRRDVAPESLARAAASKRQLTKPLRRRAYGDGNELDAFDDLPTSNALESKYQKSSSSVAKPASNPGPRKIYQQHNTSSTSIARAETHALRALQQSNLSATSIARTETSSLRTLQHQNLSSTSIVRTETPALRMPMSPSKMDLGVPRFAQSTTASLARKQRNEASSPQALRHPPGLDHAPTLSAPWKVNAANRNLTSPRHALKRSATKTQQKPHLIKQLGSNTHETRSVKGMSYNPALFRWEGNEHALAPFDVPASPVNVMATPSSKPALIANVGSTKGVQVVGGMVFDPQRMCWLKMAPSALSSCRGRSESGALSLATEDDEEDPFAGLDDLEVDDFKSKVGAGGSGAARDAGSDDDWAVGEEFDVGPEFVRRQRNEEEKWRRRLCGWKVALEEAVGLDESRWEIRNLVLGGR